MSVEGTPPRFRRARRSTTERLREAVIALGQHHGQIIMHSEKPWASITFAGTRHLFTIMFSGEEAVPAGDQFIAELSEHEFTLPGQLVADASVIEIEQRLLPRPRMLLQCELLLLEDA